MSSGEATTPNAKAQEWVGIMLAFIGGFVDAVGYLVLYKMFTAHLSGDSIAMGIHVAQQDWPEALHRGFAIPVFIIGLAAGTAFQELLSRMGARSTYATTFALEILCLALFIGFGQPLLTGSEVAASPWWRFYLIAALPALAMGLQNATVHRVNLGTVRTTYITNMLTQFTQESIRGLFWLADYLLGRPPGKDKFSVGHIVLTGLIWCGYVGGALAATVTRARWELYCLLIPIACLVATMAYDLVQPLESVDQEAPGVGR